MGVQFVVEGWDQKEKVKKRKINVKIFILYLVVLNISEGSFFIIKFLKF